MTLQRALTVILPVRGRVDFTRRWLEWAKSSALSCAVIVADGSDPDACETVARTVVAGASQGMPWSHRAASGSALAVRIADAAASIATPYALLSANDDFPLTAGLSACVLALEAHRATSVCGGPACAVALPASEPIWSGRARARASIARAPVDAATEIERVEALLNAYDPPWYDVHRAEVLRGAFSRVLASGIRDMNLLELTHACAVAAAGPILRTEVPHLARQEDVAGSASAEIAEHGDLLAEILSEGWGSQFDAFVGSVGIDRRRVRAAYERYARATFARTPNFDGRTPLRRRVAAALESAMGPKAIAALRRVRALHPAPTLPSAELASILAFLSRKPVVEK